MLSGKRILVAPLDWGLGHSTRCIPIIQRLIERGGVPVIGADNGPLALLRSEFPQLEHVRIPGANIRYSKGASQLWSMARQFPEMVRSVRAENALFDRIRTDLRLNAVISDQRFGLRSPDLPSVLITHQVFPFTPIAQGALRKLNLRHMSRFHKCWIMDEAKEPGLAGELSHGRSLPTNARYIGTVSRMARAISSAASNYRIVAVISGPEPHRTLLDGILSEQLQRIEGEHLLVRGLPANSEIKQIGNVRCVPHLNSTQLAQAMASAELIVSRSGYTTLMDLVALGRSAVVIPTPGQAEQEYLGELHSGTGRFFVQSQQHIDLEAALRDRSAAVHLKPSPGHPLLEQALDELGTLLN
ncbi:MAG: glycosyltransferase [Flavobacteriales bacterium]|nr:glycosyltransferase [Flavobacteriales bacterium]